ncbi:hypothetical protein QR98_0098610 [Sarcoptes scabiei]|uniref:Uncharacterized protein n=1 Tax=Sarcoptes scabiei TaxID=52283 RepID=A0A132AJZ8_SARSC|nr:hypothetical protein QR98_0098610 [Sarcoptes scabiei]
MDSLAMKIISCNISPKDARRTLECRSAYQMWTEIGKIYASSNGSRGVGLFREYLDYRIPKDGQLVEHLTKIADILDKMLMNDDNLFSETHKCYQFIGKLPRTKFQPMISSFMALTEQQRTIYLTRNLTRSCHFSIKN